MNAVIVNVSVRLSKEDHSNSSKRIESYDECCNSTEDINNIPSACTAHTLHQHGLDSHLTFCCLLFLFLFQLCLAPV